MLPVVICRCYFCPSCSSLLFLVSRFLSLTVKLLLLLLLMLMLMLLLLSLLLLVPGDLVVNKDEADGDESTRMTVTMTTRS